MNDDRRRFGREEGFAGKASVRTLPLASDRNCQPAARRGGALSLFLTRRDRLEPWGANTCAPLVSPRFPRREPGVLTPHRVFIRGVCARPGGWSRCRDGQPLS